MIDGMFRIGKFIDKIEYDDEGIPTMTEEFQDEHVLYDDWVFIGEKWIRVTKIRIQKTGQLIYYNDGKLAHVMMYADMNQMYKDLSALNPLNLDDLEKPKVDDRG